MRTRARQLRFAAVFAALATVGCAALAAGQTPAWPSSSAPRPLPFRETKFPPFDVRTLPNGLPVVIVVRDEQPAISIRVIVRAGPAQDPSDKPGVASMVAALLDQGTASRTAQQVADAIDTAGGDLETGVGRDLSYVNVTVMKDGLDLGMSLLADVLRRPAFAGAELERQRQQLAGALRVSYEDPAYVADVVFDRLVYGRHPYGAPGSGTPASIEKLTRQDLVEFHRRYFVPNDCLLAVVGDVTTGEAMAAVTKAFGDWPRHDVPAERAAQPPRPARRVVVLDKRDAVQTEIRMGQIGIPRKNGDYMALNLAVKVLGGAGANRLHRVLRAERGLTYGAQADLETLRRTGEIAAQTNTRSDATGEVMRLMTDEFWRLRRERVGESELADAKAYLTGNFPLTIETPTDIAAQVLNVLFYDLPLEELRTFRQRVNAVSIDDIEWVANKYLEPDRLAVVLVGDASAFLDQLTRVGFKRVEVIPLADLDVLQPDLKRKKAPPAPAGPAPAFRAARAPSSLFTGGLRASYGQVGALPDAQPTASGLIDRAIEAKGGLEKLKAVKTLKAVAQSTFNSPQGPVTTETVTYVEYPDKFRVEARLAVGQVVQVYAGGDDAWVKDPNRGVVVPPPAARKDFRDSVRRDVLSLLLRAKEGQLTMKLRAPDKSPDALKSIRAVDLSSADMEPVTLFIDTANGMVVKEEYQLPGGGGTAEESYSDFRDVDGVKIAFRAALRRGGLLVSSRVVTDVKVNVPLDPALFVKPEKAP